MKPLHKILPRESENSFNVRHDRIPRFGNLWHYHDELELHYTIKGEGVRLIGNDMSPFSSGDIVLVGQKLAHAWRCTEDCPEQKTERNVEAIVVQFLPDFLGKDFFSLPESHNIPSLFEKAKRGLVVKGRTRTEIETLLKELINESEFGKVINLLKILCILCKSDELDEIVKTQTTFRPFNDFDKIRMNKILDFTHKNYKRTISLDEVAEITSLRKTSFCRYFKTLTDKTYHEFLTEIRIDHACRLLLDNMFPVEIICYECGFNNISNFYRHFNKIMSITPAEYKKRYIKKGPK